MDINLTYAWLLLAVALILIELAVGTLVLLSFGVSALIVSLLVAALAEVSLTVQLILFTLSNIIIVPLTIKYLRPRFSPKHTRYGTAGTGAHNGRPYLTELRDYDQTVCIRVDNDLYRAQQEDGSAPEPGTKGTLLRFEGTVAIVQTIPQTH